MKKKRVHIVGTHGVPAKYGGFETLADFLCQYLNQDFEITVYCNAYKYEEKQSKYHGVKLRYLKIEANGFKGIFYDLITYIRSIFVADVILYLSPVGSGFMTPLKYLSRVKVIVNHGGLNEWEREKLNWVQKKWAIMNHRIAAKYSDVNVVDNELYKDSLRRAFNAESFVIRYGGDHVKKVNIDDQRFSQKYPFIKERYAVSVSRAQLDNNIHLVLEAFEKFSEFKLVLVSNWEVSDYGRELKEKYKNADNMILLDAIYDKDELDYIRGNSYVYIHSHSRCGTAPSLVEAMSLNQMIISYDVATNREVTKDNALFFTDVESLVLILQNLINMDVEKRKADIFSLAQRNYTWSIIAGQYRDLINEL